MTATRDRQGYRAWLAPRERKEIKASLVRTLWMAVRSASKDLRERTLEHRFRLTPTVIHPAQEHRGSQECKDLQG